jgi:hypothetical protein
MTCRLFVILVFAAPVLLIAGCSSGAVDPGVPKTANLVAEMTGPAGSRGDRYTPLEADTDGALYVYDVTRQRLAYSGAVEKSNAIRLYPGGVAVVSTLSGRSRTAYEHWVQRFDVDVTYRIYYEPGGKPTNPTPEMEGSPMTQPYIEKMLERRPNDKFVK